MTRPARVGPPGEGASWVLRGARVEAPLLLTALPAEVPFGFLGRVLPTREEARVDLEVHPIAAPEALALLEAAESVARAELHLGEHGATGRTAELSLEAESATDVARAVAGRRQELYRVGVAVRARGRTRASAQRGRTALGRRLSALGFRFRVPRYEAPGATAPPTLGGTERRPPGYWHTLSTDGVAAFFPFLDEALVEPGGVLVGLLLDDAGPVVLDRYAHASHSWGLFGATGSGKSFAAALWAVRTLWTVPGLELYILDPLGEFGRLGRALGGTTVRLGPTTPLGFHPLDPASAGGDPVEASARVAVLLRALFPSLRDEEAAALESALGRLYEGRPGAVPTFSELREELRRGGGEAGRLPTLLDVFRTGALRHLDRPGPAPPPAPLPLVYDLSDVPEPQRAFQLTFVLMSLYDRLRGNDAPKLVIVDEAHLLAQVPGTAAYLDRLVRHVRHYRTGLLLLSQSPDDLLASEAGRSLLGNLRATVLLRLSSVSDEARRFFDLTEAEAEWLPKARLPREAGYAEGLLRHGPSHLPIALVASTPEVELLAGAGGARRPVERHV